MRAIGHSAAMMVLMLGGGCLSACAHASRPSDPALTEQSAAMTPAVDASHTLDAEQIGRRFLRLIEGLTSRSDLSEQRIREVTGIELSASEAGPFYSQPLQGDWYYLVHYVPESASLKRGVGLDFGNRKDRYVDPSPICSLNLEDYHRALEAMGFRAAATYGEMGQIVDWRYHRGDITLAMVAWPQVGTDEEGVQHYCVKSIGTLN